MFEVKRLVNSRSAVTLGPSNRGTDARTRQLGRGEGDDCGHKEMAVPHLRGFKAGEWNWGLEAGNGEIIADSAEGYETLGEHGLLRGALGAIQERRILTKTAWEVSR